MIAPPSRTIDAWMSAVGWFRAIRTWGRSPWERTGSSPARTWTQLWPPRITDWYDVYVNTKRPLRVQILARLSAVDALPSPAAPPMRKTSSFWDIRYPSKWPGYQVG